MRARSLLTVLLGAVLAVSSIGVPAPARAATVRHVPGDYPTITAALAAATAGDTVLVSPGTYLERVTVPSGVTLDSTDGPAVTIIDGEQAGTVAVIDGGATVHGFTLRHGGLTYGDVGGAKVWGTLDGSVLTENGGCYRATAVWLLGGTVANSSFAGNRGSCSGLSVVAGSGMVVGNDFDEDHAPVLALNNDSPTIEGNVFRGNSQAIRMVNDSRPLIRNNLFLVPGATPAGGAIEWLVPFSGSGPTVINNTIVKLAGGMAAPVVAAGWDASTTFANNLLVGPPDVSLIDCQDGHDGAPPMLAGNDAWTPSGSGYGGLCAGAAGAASNVSVDPVFVSAAMGDYHVRADSPLIDAGVNDISAVTDFDGDARPFDGDEDGTATVDIGFDESLDPLAVSPGSLAFGGLPLARESEASVTLTNLGSTWLSVATVQLSGGGAGDYGVTGETCSGATLAIGATCTIPVTFTPSALGDRDAVLAITGPGPVSTREVPLSGVGLDPISVTPPSVALEDVIVGDPGVAGSIEVSNSGGVAATITSITVAGDASDLSLGAETCTTAPLPSDGSCSIPFTWRPRDAGDRAADIVISGPAPVGTRTVPLTGHAWPMQSGVAWGSTAKAGPGHSWNGANALGRTVQSGRQRLHLVYATDWIGGKWVTDSGPKVGAYYVRSTSGTTWTTPFRLNPTSEHAGGLGLAASGAKVYTVWSSQTRYIRYSPTAPRVLYVRVNTSHGAASAWRSRIRLSSSTGRVDYPVIAASGSDAHIAYTNAASGTVYVRSSRDGGRTWSRLAVGSTSIAFRDGRTGFPAVAADGTSVVACWLADMAGTINCRVSTNRGVSWGTATVVGSQANGYFSVAVRGSRIAVAWTTPTNVVIRQRVSGTWRPAQTIPSPYQVNLYGAVVALQDPNRVRVTWTDGDGGDFSYVLSSESPDGGAMWLAFEAVGTSGANNWQNDWPSMIWPTAGSRYVVWNGWTANIATYRLYLRRGTGAGAGPLLPAATWAPSEATHTVGETDGPRVMSVVRPPASRDAE